MHRNVYMSSILAIVLKATLIKINSFSSTLFKSVEYLNVIEDLGLVSQPGCPCMQIHSSYFDHQCHMWVYFYFLLDIELTYKIKFKTKSWKKMSSRLGEGLQKFSPWPYIKPPWSFEGELYTICSKNMSGLFHHIPQSVHLGRQGGLGTLPRLCLVAKLQCGHRQS